MRALKVLLFLLALVLLFSGCEGGSKKEGDAAKATNETGRLTTEATKARRTLERELDRDAKAYLSQLRDRFVDKAVEYVTVEKRKEETKNLWRFIGKYEIETFELKEKTIVFDGEHPTATLVYTLVVFEKGVVKPILLDLSTKWARTGERWLIIT
jgi:hypothetical protein